MSKEYLVALENMKNRLIDAKFTIEGTTLYSKDKDLDDDYKLLYKALQRLSDIDNSKPSEALELIYCLKDYHLNMVPYYDWLNTIEKYILKAQEMEKVLGIIKEKRIDIESFYTSFVEGEYDYDFYERYYGTYGKYCLTEAEFNTLKEGLKNE